MFSRRQHEKKKKRELSAEGGHALRQAAPQAANVTRNQATVEQS